MSNLSRHFRSLATRYDWFVGRREGIRYSFGNPYQVSLISITSPHYYSTLTRTGANYDHTFIKVSSVAQLNLNQRRFKKKKARSSKEEQEEEEGEDDDDEELANENPLLVDDILGETSDGSEKMTININSLRLDAFCKAAFGTTRAKVEESFYKGDIRVNGELPPKKSFEIQIGDEIDIFKHTDPEDSRLIHIRKALVVKMPDKATETGRIKMDINRWQNLVVEKPKSDRDGA